MPARDSTIDRHTSDLIPPDRADDSDSGDGQADGDVRFAHVGAVILSRRHPGGVEDGEESPAGSRESAVRGFSRGFFAVLSPYRGIGGSE